MEPQTVATAAAQKRKRPGQETTATTSSSSSADSALCTNGCCFLGTAADKGMCSKCYRERHPAGDDTERPDQEVKAVRSTSVFAVPPPLKKIKLSVPTIGSSSAGAASSAGAVDTSSSPANTATQKKEGPAKPATATANRCMTCRKKVGLTGFQCRCGGTFCGSHRYADAHACGFDYKAAGREQIAKQNPVVVAAKIAKI